ncbi:MAG: sulfur oxidation c-type cytochrome SoxX [Gammaproteobacteria bacterium]|nr:sulfur oxidation c-type cytochrome SoxX [Gammaproteobacteria bacterium]
MKTFKHAIATAVSVAALLGSLGLVPMSASAADGASSVEQGKAIAFDRKKGNCLGCHAIAGGDLPGNIGPPLIAMKARFPDRNVLRDQIADATKRNPNSAMPPFGRHGVMSADEIEKVTDFIHTL